MIGGQLSVYGYGDRFIATIGYGGSRTGANVIYWGEDQGVVPSWAEPVKPSGSFGEDAGIPATWTEETKPLGSFGEDSAPVTSWGERANPSVNNWTEDPTTASSWAEGAKPSNSYAEAPSPTGTPTEDNAPSGPDFVEDEYSPVNDTVWIEESY